MTTLLRWLGVVVLLARDSAQAQPQNAMAELVRAYPDVVISARAAMAAHSSGVLFALDSSGRLYAVRDDGSWRKTAIFEAGPNGLSGAETMGFVGDTLWIWLPSTRRMMLLDSGMRSLRVDTVPAWPAILPGADYRPKARLASGETIVEESGGLIALSEQMTRGRLVLRLDRAGTVADTLWRLATANVALLFETSDGGALAVRQPWAAPDFFAVSATGDRLVVVQQPQAPDSSGGSINITIRRLEMGRTKSYVVRYSPQPFREEIAEDLISRLNSEGTLQRFADQAAVRHHVRQALYRPRFLPAVAKVLVGADSSLWLRRYGTATVSSWMILADDGLPRGEVAFPADVDVRAVTSRRAWALVGVGDGVKLALYDATVRP
ncbi:MAG: hypothetical protein ACT4PJ_09530 [Gemmatimonadaceae bacterium]